MTLIGEENQERTGEDCSNHEFHYELERRRSTSKTAKLCQGASSALDSILTVDPGGPV